MESENAFPIETLSVEDKLILMERLWNDLSHQPSNIPIPDWHRDILADRLEALENGTMTFVDWEEVKQQMRCRMK